MTKASLFNVVHAVYMTGQQQSSMLFSLLSQEASMLEEMHQQGHRKADSYDGPQQMGDTY